MSNALIIFIYSIVCYGLSNMIVFASGPFRIFEHIRALAANISGHFGSLFNCMICVPANLGWIFSLINWFFLSSIAITPFNILLSGTGLWWAAMIGDCCFTTGIVWLIHNIEAFFENLGNGNQPYDDNNTIDVHN